MKARDYRAEITAAVQAGNVSDLAAIAHQLLGKVEHDDERRARNAEKKAAERALKKVSATSGMSPVVAGRRATSGDVADGVQQQRDLKADKTPPTREAVADVDDVVLQGKLDAMREKCGPEHWPDVEAFLCRRDYVKWDGWLDEMHKLVKMGSQFTPDDLGRVCRDDRLLSKPLGSAFALRTFLGNARNERLAGGQRSPPAGAARAGSPSRRDTKPAGVPIPPTETAAGIKWQT